MKLCLYIWKNTPNILVNQNWAQTGIEPMTLRLWITRSANLAIGFCLIFLNITFIRTFWVRTLLSNIFLNIFFASLSLLWKTDRGHKHFFSIHNFISNELNIFYMQHLRDNNLKIFFFLL